MTEKSESRSLNTIIEEICVHPENALKILHNLNDEEHEAMTSSELFVTLQRAKGLACYDVIAAYCMGTEKERSWSQSEIARGRQDCTYLKGALDYQMIACCCLEPTTKQR